MHGHFAMNESLDCSSTGAQVHQRHGQVLLRIKVFGRLALPGQEFL